MLAVLSDAIELVLRDGGAVNARKAILIRRAAEWISSNDRGWAFSFVNICEALGIEPEPFAKGSPGSSSNEPARTEAHDPGTGGVGDDVVAMGSPFFYNPAPSDTATRRRPYRSCSRSA